MRKFRLYTIGLVAGLAATFVACQDSMDDPMLNIPHATMTPNSTIYEIKSQYWDDATNYIDTIGLTASGEHVVISGRVISSDASGNIYKSLVIQDQTGALALSVNANSMFNDYRIGQEIVIDLTDMYIGKYNGLQQLGFPEYSDRYGWEATFMPKEFLTKHIQLNGLPEPSKVDTLDVALSSLSSLDLVKWQSQLVRFNNVYFEDGGKKPFADENASANRKLLDDSGASIIVRNSNYSRFKNDILPEGHGDVVGILSYYGTSGWQLLLRSADDCMNFGNPTLTPGTEDNPYTVDQAREIVGNNVTGWMTGYIVGAVGPEVTEISSNEDIEWEAPTTLANTLVIAPTPETKNIAECFVMALPQGSALRQVGNLKDNPGVLKKQIWVYGMFDKYMNVNGVLNNSGATSEFKIDGVVNPDQPAGDGNGTAESPYSVSQVIAGTATGTAWVSGYIVGWVDGMTLSTGATFTVPATSQTNVLIAATAGETDVNKCIPVQLPSGTIRTALNLMAHPDNLGKKVSLNASIEKYFGTTGLKSATEYKLGEGGGDTPTPDPSGGNGSETSPYTIAQVNSGAATGTSWVGGYIVGWVDGMTLSTGATFTVPATSQTNVLIADSPDTKNVAQCIPVQLPSGSVRSALNLVANPENLGKKVAIYGSIEAYFGTTGLKSASKYTLEGGDTPVKPVEPVTSLNETFDAAQAIPTGWKTAMLQGSKEWYVKEFSGNNYASCSGYKGTAPFDSWLISPPVKLSGTAMNLSFSTQVNGYGSTTSVFEVYVLSSDDPATATKTKLNATIATAPNSGYSSWVESGSLNIGKTSGTVYIGFRYAATQDTNYATWCVDNVVLK